MIPLVKVAMPPKARLMPALEQVLYSGFIAEGEHVYHFEKQFAEQFSLPIALAMSSGTAALHVALLLSGVQPGDEVITTPMTAFATVLAILRSGATPVLADIDAASGLLSPDSVRRCLSARTRAIVLVHLYGQMRNMDGWVTLCSEARVELIEDCAQSHLARWNGRVAGSFGVVGAYSFYPTKNLGAIGDGGALVTESEALALRVGRLRNYGQSERYVHPELGMNSRLDEIQAALLTERLCWLDRFTERRRTIVYRYNAAIANVRISFLAPPEQALSHVHHLFVVLCIEREALAKHLADRGVNTLIHYPIPVHRQASCEALARDPQGLSAAEAHAATCLSIPCHPQMSDDDVQQVIDALNSFA